MKKYWFLLCIWYLEGREKRLINDMNYHYERQLASAQAAWEIHDMLQRPKEWAIHTHNANWHGYHRRLSHARCREVRTRINKLKALVGS